MITLLAGVNGAGKSSLFGSYLRTQGYEYYNPDETAKQSRQKDKNLSLEQANSKAWMLGKKLLLRAIKNNDDFTFETTLGGKTITRILLNAAKNGRKITLIYCGLESIELHLKRVEDRVANGGHQIPEKKIRQRWLSSMENMIKLIAVCHGVSVFDNSTPLIKGKPNPKKLFAFSENQWLSLPIKDMPDWAKPLATTAIKRLSK